MSNDDEVSVETNIENSWLKFLNAAASTEALGAMAKEETIEAAAGASGSKRSVKKRPMKKNQAQNVAPWLKKKAAKAKKGTPDVTAKGQGQPTSGGTEKRSSLQVKMIDATNNREMV